MALRRPAGNAMSMAMVDTRRVPPTRGSTPKDFFRKRGVHEVPNRKSVIGTSSRKANVSKSKTPIMPAVTPIEARAHRKSAPSMMRSRMF